MRLHALRVLETGEPLLLRIVPGEARRRPRRRGGRGDGRQPVPERRRARALPRAAPARRRAWPSPASRRSRAALVELGERARASRVAARRDGRAGRLRRASSPRTGTRRGGGARARAATRACAYVGLVASRAARRGGARRAARRLPDELRARVHTPAGLDIGARTHEEIALSILAELVAVRRARGAVAPAPCAAPREAVDPVCGMEVAVGAGHARSSTAATSRSAARAAATRWLAADGPRVSRSSPGSCSPPGGSSRLGRPEAAAAVRRRDAARPRAGDGARLRASTSCVVALGGAADEVRAQVDLSRRRGRRQRGATARAARRRSRRRSARVDPRCRRARAAARRPARRRRRRPCARCSPAAATRRSPSAATTTAAATRSRSPAPLFGELRALHGDKAVWKLLDRRRRRRRRGAGRRAGAARRRHLGGLRGACRASRAARPGRARRGALGWSRTSTRSRRGSTRVDYLADEGLATALFLALRLPQPLLLEGEAGVGKTEAAQGARRRRSARR